MQYLCQMGTRVMNVHRHMQKHAFSFILNGHKNVTFLTKKIKIKTDIAEDVCMHTSALMRLHYVKLAVCLLANSSQCIYAVLIKGDNLLYGWPAERQWICLVKKDGSLFVFNFLTFCLLLCVGLFVWQIQKKKKSAFKLHGKTNKPNRFWKSHLCVNVDKKISYAYTIPTLPEGSGWGV